MSSVVSIDRSGEFVVHQQTAAVPSDVPTDSKPSPIDVLAKARELKITSSIEYIVACDAKLAIDAMLENRHAVHDPVVQSAHSTWQKAIGARKADIDPLEEAKRIYVAAIDRWSREQERLALERARAEEERLAREAEAAREQEILEAESAGASVEEVEAIVDRPLYVPPVIPEKVAVQSAVPKVAGIRKRPENWAARLDPKRPGALRELIQFCARDARFEGLLTVNEQAANALAKSLKSSMAVPGLVAYDKNAV